MLRVIMENRDAPVELDAFEQESQRLLLDISLGNSNRELHEIVVEPPQHSLRAYYKELQEWRAPVMLPSQQAWQIVKSRDAV